jgi:hypothetical protein
MISTAEHSEIGGQVFKTPSYSPGVYAGLSNILAIEDSYIHENRIQVKNIEYCIDVDHGDCK